jgi:hypothetical protein
MLVALSPLYILPLFGDVISRLSMYAHSGSSIGVTPLLLRACCPASGHTAHGVKCDYADQDDA